MWRVRVDLLLGEAPLLVDAVHQHHVERLGAASMPDTSVGVDEGIGTSRDPVIGLGFWVQAPDVGGAASEAVRLAVDAVAAACGRELDLYDVTVMPASAVQASVGHEVPRIAD
jgi:hypothetical protein